jgi:cysteinyl-tRNA synthetase
MSGHWSKPIDYSDEVLEQARAQWRSFGHAIYEARPARPTTPWETFEAALEDDFNTPEALAVLHEWRRASDLELLNRGLSIFGLGFVPEPAPDQVQELVREREHAREARDFAAADQLRLQIRELGWAVEDTADGPVLIPA